MENNGTAGEQSQNSTINNGDSTTEQPLIIKEEDYKSLQAEYTRSNQDKIELAIKLAQKDPQSIIEIKDTKLQNKVIENIYGYKNLNELQAILGTNFYEGGNQDEDESKKLKKEVELLKYRNEERDIAYEISQIRLSNPQLFETTPEESEEKIRKELSYISKDLPMNERVKRACLSAFGGNYNPTTDAYKQLQQANISSQGTKGDSKKVEINQNGKELANLFKSL